MAVNQSVYIIISYSNEITFIIGVYSKRDDAERDYIEIIFKQRNFHLLQDLFGDEFSAPLPKSVKSLQKYIFHEEELRDFFEDTLKIDILKVSVGKLFYFADYKHWDERNLNDALSMILEGQTERLRVPFDKDDMLLRDL